MNDVTTPEELPQPSPLLSRGNLIFFAALVGVLLVYLFVLAPMSRRSQTMVEHAIGAKLSLIQLSPLDAPQTVIESDQLIGKVTLINFWATWCHFCVVELPHLDALNKQFRDRPDFQLMAATTPAPGESVDELREQSMKFLAARKLTLPAYIDVDGVTQGALQMASGAGGSIPMTVILDRTGVIRGMWAGYQPGLEADFERLVTELLAE